MRTLTVQARKYLFCIDDNVIRTEQEGPTMQFCALLLHEQPLQCIYGVGSRATWSISGQYLSAELGTILASGYVDDACGGSVIRDCKSVLEQTHQIQGRTI